MYIDILNNLAITSTFLFFVGRLFQNRPLDITSPLKTRVYLGISSGILGLALMMSTIYITDTVILDLRHLAIVIAAIFGGPVSAIISGIIIGIIRILLNGISITSIAAAAVVIINGILFGYYSKKNISIISKYILMHVSYVTASSGIIYVFVNNSRIANKTLLFYWGVTIVAGVFIYYIVEYIKKSNENHRSILYFKLMAENSSDLISTHGLDGRFKYLSPSSIKILGYESKELIGKNPYEFYHVDDVTEVNHSHTAVINKSKEFTVRYRFKRKDGEYIWLETASKLMKSKGSQPVEIICASRDITTRKQIEEELQNANQKLHILSNLDGLTEIPNRRRFDEKLNKEWKRALENAAPLSLIMFDIDHFKFYNDLYGHQQGDECIKEVAKTAQSLLDRSNDFIARYGGEEFAVILPNTNQEHSKEIAEQLRKKIQELSIPHKNSKVLPIVTISVGVSTLIPTPDTNFLQLIITADEALYKAKEVRNQVKSAFEE